MGTCVRAGIESKGGKGIWPQERPQDSSGSRPLRVPVGGPDVARGANPICARRVDSRAGLAGSLRLVVCDGVGGGGLVEHLLPWVLPRQPRSVPAILPKHAWTSGRRQVFPEGADVVPHSFFFFSTFIYFWDRERQSMNGGGAEREGDTESETGSRL